MKIVIVGAGHLGLTMAQAFLTYGVCQQNELTVFQRSEARAAVVRAKLGCLVTQQPSAKISEAEVVIFSVKPQDFEAAVGPLSKYLGPNQFIVSVMAGIPLERLTKAFPEVTQVVRSMPNLPAKIGRGVTAYVATKALTDENARRVEKLFASFGAALRVEKEELIDAATAVSGSGPAYVFSFIDAFVNAACAVGFDQAQARILVGKTIDGALMLWQQGEASASELRERTRSKGGTTQAALQVMEQRGFESIMLEAVNAAFERAKQLGRV